jgi:ferredoxin
MFIALWQNGNPPQSELITSPDQLDRADPFAPVMYKNSACDALRTLEKHSSRRIGFMLRPCELQCFKLLLKKEKLTLKDGVLISFDCLATYPPEDFIWKLETSEYREQMTQSSLHFAFQGGLQPSRYRTSCQFCDISYPQGADLSIELLGIKVSENLVVKSRTPEICERLGITRLNGQSVPEEITLSRERTLLRLMEWRQQAFAYVTSHLNDDHKTIDGFIGHLSECQVCRQTLQGCCPLFDLDWITSSTYLDVKALETWLPRCSGCGMCETKCPEGFPLFRAILFLSKTLRP